MADSLAKATLASSEITLGGKTFQILPHTIEDYKKLASFLMTRRLETFLNSEAAKGLPTAERIQVITQITKDMPTEYELAREAMTIDGLVFMVWRMMLKTDPKITLEEVPKMVNNSPLSIEELQAALNSLNEVEIEGGKKNDLPLAGTG